MFHPFISSQSASAGRLGAGAVFSIAAHVVLISAAVAATAVPKHTKISDGDVVEHLRFAEITRFRESPARRVRSRVAPSAARANATRVLPLPPLSSVHLELPESVVELATVSAPTVDLDFGAMASKAIDFLADPSEFVRGVLGRSGQVAQRDGAFTEDAVEKAVMPRRGNPPPDYPRALQSAHIEDSFIVTFVVDSTGQVDASTMNFPNTVHRLLVDAVRRALTRSRFYPAELAGRRVRQLVEQRFTFMLKD